MAQRITDTDLRILCERLNELTGSPATYMTAIDGSPRQINVGHFHISGAYGGVCLHRVSNASGGITCPLVSYHEPKRALWDRMHAFIDGIEFERQAARAGAKEA